MEYSRDADKETLHSCYLASLFWGSKGLLRSNSLLLFPERNSAQNHPLGLSQRTVALRGRITVYSRLFLEPQGDPRVLYPFLNV